MPVCRGSFTYKALRASQAYREAFALARQDVARIRRSVARIQRDFLREPLYVEGCASATTNRISDARIMRAITRLDAELSSDRAAEVGTSRASRARSQHLGPRTAAPRSSLRQPTG